MNEVCHLKVLHVASGDLWAGAEAQLFTLAKVLHTKSDTSVSVALLNYGRLEQELHNAGIKVIVLDESKLNGLQILRLLVHTIREQKPDVIHTHRLKENILGSIAALLTGRTPSLRTAHGAPEHRPSWWKFPKRIIYFLDWFCGRFLQCKIIAVSEDLARILRNNFPADRVRVIENGIDLASIRGERAPLPAENDTKSAFKVGFAGRLVPVKRVDLFIRTARYLLDHHPDLHASFHIYGDGPMRNELEKLSQILCTGDIVYFEGHCKDILHKLQELDALLMTSDHEGLPMILLEAMALQTPIIAHAVGGIPDLLDQGACGILVKKHSAHGYAQKIYKFANNPEHLSVIAQKALDRVSACYSAELNAHAYRAEYASICKQQKPA